MKEALKLALEALENHCGNYKLDDAGCERWNKAVAAIKEALAQPEQRPWVGLTDEQREACTQSPFTEDNYDDIEAKLKELNT